jgi:hypothetical protein
MSGPGQNICRNPCVGRKVRRTMIETSGKRPEDLPPAEDIKQVHKKLKSSHREIKKLDKLKG